MREIHERFAWYVRMGTIRTGGRMQGTKTQVNQTKAFAPDQAAPNTRRYGLSAAPRPEGGEDDAQTTGQGDVQDSLPGRQGDGRA
jgi:hypothetical protein